VRESISITVRRAGFRAAAVSADGFSPLPLVRAPFGMNLAQMVRHWNANAGLNMRGAHVTLNKEKQR
jgi:hypothetical protein